MDAIVWAKIALGAVLVWIVAMASSVEPSQAVWGAAISGSLMAVIVGQDRSIRQMFFHSLMGIAVSLALSTIIVVYLPIPKWPLAFLVSLIGARAAIYCMESGERGDWSWLRWFIPSWRTRQ